MLEHFLDYLSNIPGEWALTLVLVILLLCGIGFPLPEEILIIAAGYLAYLEVASVGTVTALVLLAVLIGDATLYWIGWKYGNKIFLIPPFKNMVTPERMNKANHYFQRWGNRVVFVARFLAGVRGTVFVTAGILKMPFKRFIILDSLAAIITIPLNIYIVHRFGEEIGTAIAYLKEFKHFLLMIIFFSVGVLAIIYIIRRRNRRVRKVKRDLKNQMNLPTIETAQKN